MSDDFLTHLDELLAEDLLRPAAPDELTRRMIMEREGITWIRTRSLIDRWIASGKIQFVGYRLTAQGKREKAFKFTPLSSSMTTSPQPHPNPPQMGTFGEGADLGGEGKARKK